MIRDPSRSAQDEIAALRLFQILIHEVPVHHVPECFDVFRARVAVVDIIRVLPYVAGQQRMIAMLDRGIRVMRADDPQRSFRVANQPCPPGAEMARRHIAELLLERREITE